MKKRFLYAFSFIFFFSGCLTVTGSSEGGSFYAEFDGQQNGKPQSGIQSFGEAYDISSILPLSNGEKVTLKKGTYKGNLSINQSKVWIKGNGAGKTVLYGTVYINGSFNELKDLTISGNVFIYGSNNKLSGVKVTGSVTNYGQNNKY